MQECSCREQILQGFRITKTKGAWTTTSRVTLNLDRLRFSLTEPRQFGQPTLDGWMGGWRNCNHASSRINSLQLYAI